MKNSKHSSIQRSAVFLLLGTCAAMMSSTSSAQPRDILALDSDGDGLVSRDEFRVPADRRGRRLFKHGDVDGDGTLTRDELITSIESGSEERQERTRERLLERFDAMDGNGDGVVQADEAMEQAFSRVDQNADGYLSEEEARALRDQRKRHRENRPSS